MAAEHPRRRRIVRSKEGWYLARCGCPDGDAWFERLRGDTEDGARTQVFCADCDQEVKYVYAVPVRPRPGVRGPRARPRRRGR